MGKRARRGGGGRSFTEALGAAEKGDFEPLVGDCAEDWWEFVREHLQLGTDQFMLRIELEDPAFGPWYAWVVYEQVDRGSSIALTGLLIPDYTTNPEAALAIPRGYEQVPYFGVQFEGTS
jgi:hypothetical protein